MKQRWDWRQASGRRLMEQASILLFAAGSLIFLLVEGWLPLPQEAEARESAAVSARANAMPSQGWAPLKVYFSAYGSRSEGDRIVRYEWDLDGNGLFDYDASGQDGYSSYLYSKPGEYTITLRVTDSQGRSGTDRLVVSVRNPGSSSVDYWTVFDDRQLGRIDISLDQAGWERVWREPMAKVQARAEAVVFGERMPEVGFRMRGQFSLLASADKKPWRIDTDAYIDGQEFHNLRQLLLLNNIGDPSLLQEKLAYEMMRFAGLPASHVSFVELWIDIQEDAQPPLFWGVYSLVERVDNKYLENRFGRASQPGNLYKASHAQRGPMNLVYYGESIEEYPTQNGQYAYGKVNNETGADYSDIIQLCRVVDGSTYASEDDYSQALEEVLNVDAFLRYIAVIMLINNYDSYPFTGNNYYLYNEPNSGKFQWIPWDLAWGGPVQLPLYPKAGGELVGRAPLYDGVFKVERYRLKYEAYLDLLLRYWFTPENVADLAYRYHDLIDPYIKQGRGDRAFFGEQAMFSYRDFQNSVQGLIDFTTGRRAFLLSQLASEGPGAQWRP